MVFRRRRTESPLANGPGEKPIYEALEAAIKICGDEVYLIMDVRFDGLNCPEQSDLTYLATSEKVSL